MYTGSIPVLASIKQALENSSDNDGEAHAQELSTDFPGGSMLTKDALKLCSEKHLSDLKFGDERLRQLNRALGKFSRRELHMIKQKELTDALSQWQGATCNRYRSALLHFWRWARSEGLIDLNPTFMPGKEAPRD